MRSGHTQDKRAPDILLVREAAAIVRVSPATIRAAVRRGDLAAVEIGYGRLRRHLRITRTALQEWLKARPQPATGSPPPAGMLPAVGGTAPRVPNLHPSEEMVP
jgi:excisionase family DNA binding protein